MKCCLGDSLEVAWAETKQLKQELKQHLLFLKKKKRKPLSNHARFKSINLRNPSVSFDIFVRQIKKKEKMLQSEW